MNLAAEFDQARANVDRAQLARMRDSGQPILQRLARRWPDWGLDTVRVSGNTYHPTKMGGQRMIIIAVRDMVRRLEGKDGDEFVELIATTLARPTVWYERSGAGDIYVAGRRPWSDQQYVCDSPLEWVLSRGVVDGKWRSGVLILGQRAA